MHKPTMRTVSRWMVVSLVVVVGASIALHSALAGTPGTAPTTTTNLTAGKTLDGRPAPDFTLRDQVGNVIRLSASRGRVVVISFLDATCMSTCAVSAQCLDQTGHLLGVDANQVVWLAVSVNPHNTPADAQAFIAKHHITVPFHLLLGSPDQLRAVWQAYGMALSLPSAGGSSTGAMESYVIDTSGHEREMLAQSYDPQAAAHDLRSLIAS